MKKFGSELPSKPYWENESGSYVSALTNDYHRHRLSAIRRLIPREVMRPGARIFDFGCGDAVLFGPFLREGARIEGVDCSTGMIRLARERLQNAGHDPGLAREGDVTALGQIQSASLDALLSFNVLAYLDPKEERRFYQEAQRIVKPGGFLVVTHSNELFDLFSLNRYTLEFFKKYFVRDASYHEALNRSLAFGEAPENPATYNIRENPLTYKDKLARCQFKEIKQEFMNLHRAPPPVLGKKDYPDTSRTGPDQQWTLMFVCSIYGSCAVRLP